MLVMLVPPAAPNTNGRTGTGGIAPLGGSRILSSNSAYCSLYAPAGTVRVTNVLL